MTAKSLPELASLLCREQDVLDRLVTRLGDRAGDGGESEEYAGLLWSISGLELHRAITAREAAVELGLDGDATLQDIVARASDEWASVLAGHRRALLALVDQARLLGRPARAVLQDQAKQDQGNVVVLTDSRGAGVQRSLEEFLA